MDKGSGFPARNGLTTCIQGANPWQGLNAYQACPSVHYNGAVYHRENSSDLPNIVR